MQLKTLMGAGAALATLLLSGCAPMTKVKDVLADKQAFMDANFAPDKLTRDVASTVSAADPGPLGFHKMVFHLEWQLNDDDKNKSTAMQQTVTYTASTGSLVQEQIDNARNGVPISQSYGLDYRGFIELKGQSLNVGAAMAGFPYEVKSFRHFDAVSHPATAGVLDYQYKSGTTAQFMNFMDGRRTCTMGADYAASKIHAELAGEARDLDCVDYNANGVKRDRVRMAYLEQYGVAILQHTEYAAGISDAKVSSVSIE